MIIDEAQAIRNYKAQRSAAAPLLEVSGAKILFACQTAMSDQHDSQRGTWHAAQAKYRWLMSGTPIQNSPEELFSYFVFLDYKPFNTDVSFRKLMREAAVLKNGQPAVDILKKILAPIMLRRTKESKIDGVPIVPLPGRYAQVGLLLQVISALCCFLPLHIVAAFTDCFFFLQYRDCMQWPSSVQYAEAVFSSSLSAKIQSLMGSCITFRAVWLRKLMSRNERFDCALSVHGRQVHKVSLHLNATEQCLYDALASETLENTHRDLPAMHRFAKLTRMRMACIHPSLQDARRSLRSEQHLASGPEPDFSREDLLSTKLDYIRHLALASKLDGEKLLVFSKWTAPLDLLEPALRKENITYCRLNHLPHLKAVRRCIQHPASSSS